MYQTRFYEGVSSVMALISPSQPGTGSSPDSITRQRGGGVCGAGEMGEQLPGENRGELGARLIEKELM